MCKKGYCISPMPQGEYHGLVVAFSMASLKPGRQSSSKENLERPATRSSPRCSWIKSAAQMWDRRGKTV